MHSDWKDPATDKLVARVHDSVSAPEALQDAIVQGSVADVGVRGDAMAEMAHAMTLPFEEDVNLGNPLCQRCEVLPHKLTGPGTLLVNLPHTHTLGKAMRWVKNAGFDYSEATGVLSIRVPEGSLDPVVAPLTGVLSPTERRMTRVVYRPDGELPQKTDAFSVEDIGTFAARAGGGWLIDLLREKRLVVHFQPIVSGDRGTSVFGYECLARGISEDGLVPPSRIFSVAQQADLAFQVDLAARRAALLGAAEHGVSERIFINFTPNAIFDAAYCLDSTVRLVDELHIPREQVVFELVETERLPETSHLQSIVAYYRDKGFGVALDDVGAGYASLQVLLDIRPNYAKIDMALTRDVHRDERKAILTSRLLDTAHELGARTVVEGVEVREEWDWARACGADYAQGYFFGKPAPEPRPVSLSN